MEEVGDASVPFFFSPQPFTTVIHNGNVLPKCCLRGCVHTDCPACPCVKGKAHTYKNLSKINCLDISLQWASWHFQGSWLSGGERPSSSCTGFLLAWGFGYSPHVSKAVLVDKGVPEWLFLSCNGLVFVSGLLPTVCWPSLCRDARFQLPALRHVLPNDQGFSPGAADTERLCHHSWHTLALSNDIGCCCARHKLSHAFSWTIYYCDVYILLQPSEQEEPGVCYTRASLAGSVPLDIARSGENIVMHWPNGLRVWFKPTLWDISGGALHSRTACWGLAQCSIFCSATFCLCTIPGISKPRGLESTFVAAKYSIFCKSNAHQWLGT